MVPGPERDAGVGAGRARGDACRRVAAELTGPSVPEPPPGLAFRQTLETRFEHDLGFYLEILQLFVETARPPVAEIRTALGGHDLPGVGRPAHYLRGSALGVGATGLAEAAGALEALAQHPGSAGGDDVAAAWELLASLERELAACGQFTDRLAPAAQGDPGS